MITKTEKVRRLFEKGDIKGTLRECKSFRIGLTRQDRDMLARGYECLLYPDFYRSLGFQPSEEVEKAVSIFKDKIYRQK